jgi:hypothetical protein
MDKLRAGGDLLAQDFQQRTLERHRHKNASYFLKDNLNMKSAKTADAGGIRSLHRRISS